MTFRLSINDGNYTDFLSVSVSNRLDNLADRFEIRVTSSERKPLPFSGNEACQISIDDEKILDGYLEKLSVTYSSDVHNITLAGRDRTCDVVDSYIGSLIDTAIGGSLQVSTAMQIIIDNMYELNPDVNLLPVNTQRANLLTANLQYTTNFRKAPIQVYYSGSAEPLIHGTQELIAPEPGERVYQYLEKIGKSKQLIVTSDRNGDIQLIRTSEAPIISHNLVNRVSSDSNNILKGSIVWDYSRIYGKYELVGSDSFVAATGISGGSAAAPIEEAVNKHYTLYTNDIAGAPFIREGRNYVIVNENSTTPDFDEKRLEWEMNIRNVRSNVYSCTVHGHRDNSGNLWTPNTLVNILDEYCGVDQVMLLNSVLFTFDGDSGTNTVLGFVHRDAYSYLLAPPMDGAPFIIAKLDLESDNRDRNE